MSTYKLQVNETGAWRDVLTRVSGGSELQVMAAVEVLKGVAERDMPRISFRLYDPHAQRAVAHLQGSEWEYRNERAT